MEARTRARARAHASGIDRFSREFRHIGVLLSECEKRQLRFARLVTASETTTRRAHCTRIIAAHDDSRSVRISKWGCQSRYQETRVTRACCCCCFLEVTPSSRTSRRILNLAAIRTIVVDGTATALPAIVGRKNGMNRVSKVGGKGDGRVVALPTRSENSRAVPSHPPRESAKGGLRGFVGRSCESNPPPPLPTKRPEGNPSSGGRVEASRRKTSRTTRDNGSLVEREAFIFPR